MLEYVDISLISKEQEKPHDMATLKEYPAFNLEVNFFCLMLFTTKHDEIFILTSIFLCSRKHTNVFKIPLHSNKSSVESLACRVHFHFVFSHVMKAACSAQSHSLILSVCRNIQRIFSCSFCFLIVPVIAASLAQRFSLSELLPNAPQRPANMEISQRVCG